MDSLVIEENNYKYYISQKFNNLHILAIKQKSCKVYELILDNYQEQINYNNISIVINAEYIFQQLKQYAEKTNILTDFQFMFNKNLLVIKMSIEYIGYIKYRTNIPKRGSKRQEDKKIPGREAVGVN